jgi:hypothetical protein
MTIDSTEAAVMKHETMHGQVICQVICVDKEGGLHGSHDW